MSAETLRRAAALMRSRTINAGISPWSAEGRRVYNRDEYAHAVDDRIATHIASWHPGVALAVADWLENAAADSTYERARGDRTPTEDALAVALVFLGEQA